MKKTLGGRQLHDLEASWTAWAEEPRRESRRASRERVLLVFWLIRYGGLRLAEALNVDDRHDFDAPTGTVRVREAPDSTGERVTRREVQIPERAMAAVQKLISSPRMLRLRGTIARLDQGYVRKRFYERAKGCGIDPRLAGPQMLRQSRAAELLRANVPLCIVQKFMGQSSPAQAGSFMDFSDEDARRIVHNHLRQEALRRTSARNAFTGTVTRVTLGPATALVELVTVQGTRLQAVVTMESVHRLGMREGQLLNATVKAPFVRLEPLPDTDAAGGRGTVGADAESNAFAGTVADVRRADPECLVAVELPDGTTLCALVEAEELEETRGRVAEGKRVRASFSPFAVVLALPEELDGETGHVA